MPIQPFEPPEKKKKAGFVDYLATGLQLANAGAGIASSVKSMSKGSESKGKGSESDDPTVADTAMKRRLKYGGGGYAS